jgi:hypothetical protein
MRQEPEKKLAGALKDLPPEHWLAVKSGPVRRLNRNVDVSLGREENGHVWQGATNGQLYKIGVDR